MEFENPQAEGYLHALFSATEGDVEMVVSMYEIGLGLGLERAAAGALAEELMVEGLVELRNLSGGVSITMDGMKALDMPVGGAGSQEMALLGHSAVLSPEARESVEQLIGAIRGEAATAADSYERLEELVIDLKCLEVQLLSGRPKTAIVREILRSIAGVLEQGGGSAAAGQITRVIE